jgi:hypothetical protein
VTTTDFSIDEMAEQMYLAYQRNLHPQFNGPKWNELYKLEKHAWRMAASSATDSCLQPIRELLEDSGPSYAGDTAVYEPIDRSKLLAVVAWQYAQRSALDNP